MTIFDHESADRARSQNPNLTVFDTGQMLEPHVFEDRRPPIPVKSGSVEFDNDEGATVLAAKAHPSFTAADTIVLDVELVTGGNFSVVVNGREVWSGDSDDPRATEQTTIADLDKTSDAADWLAVGHSLDATEVAYLRSLVVPRSPSNQERLRSLAGSPSTESTPQPEAANGKG